MHAKSCGRLEIALLVLALSGGTGLSSVAAAFELDEGEYRLQPEVGHLINVEGFVLLFDTLINDAGETRLAKRIAIDAVMAPVRVFGAVETADGRAVVQFHDRDEVNNAGPSILEIAGNSYIEIKKYAVALDENLKRRFAAVVLVRGEVRGFVKGWGKDSQFSVRAGESVITIKGTEFTVKYDPGSGRLLVQVHKGRVVVATPHGSRILCAPTHGITCPKGSSTSGMFIDGKLSGGPS